MPATATCATCKLPHKPIFECVDVQRDTMKRLMYRIGETGKCSDCGAAVLWVRDLVGGKEPYDETGRIHRCADLAIAVPIPEAEAMAKLLLRVGGLSRCLAASCFAPIYWVRHANGARAPYTIAGLNHFVDCPEGGKFKR